MLKQVIEFYLNNSFKSNKISHIRTCVSEVCSADKKHLKHKVSVRCKWCEFRNFIQENPFSANFIFQPTYLLCRVLCGKRIYIYLFSFYYLAFDV